MHGSLARAFTCSVLFVELALATHVGRDLAGSIAGFLFGFPSTAFPYFKIWDRVPDTVPAALAISLAPSAFSLVSALAGVWIVSRAKPGTVRLFGLYLAGFGALYGLSDLIAIRADGPMSGVAQMLGLSVVAQWAICLNAGVMLAVAMWFIGRQLQPPYATIVVPVVASALVTPLIYAPVPWPLVMMSWIGSSPWIVAVLGALARHGRAARDLEPAADVGLSWSARLFPITLVLFIRLMLMTGVRFG